MHARGRFFWFNWNWMRFICLSTEQNRTNRVNWDRLVQLSSEIIIELTEKLIMFKYRTNRRTIWLIVFDWFLVRFPLVSNPKIKRVEENKLKGKGVQQFISPCTCTTASGVEWQCILNLWRLLVIMFNKLKHFTCLRNTTKKNNNWYSCISFWVWAACCHKRTCNCYLDF